MKGKRFLFNASRFFGLDHQRFQNCLIDILARNRTIVVSEGKFFEVLEEELTIPNSGFFEKVISRIVENKDVNLERRQRVLSLVIQKVPDSKLSEWCKEEWFPDVAKEEVLRRANKNPGGDVAQGLEEVGERARNPRGFFFDRKA